MPPLMPPPREYRFPAVVLIDSREQLPYAFADLRADAKDGGGPVLVSTARAALPSGDYSLDGYAAQVAVERKSVSDLYGTIGRGRERFERELARLADYRFAAVVVEGEWSEVLDGPPGGRGKLKPKAVFRSVLAWQQRHPGVHWWFLPGRAIAEIATLRILERFWRERAAERRATGRD